MVEKDGSSPKGHDLRRLAEDLIEEQSTMTLATAKSDTAWAAPIYYAFLKSRFYFFSDPSSRHIQESVTGGQAASAIYASSATWEGIKGIQMSGSIETVPVSLEAAEAIGAYLKKFPFTKDFFQQGQEVDLAAFSNRFRVRLYRFIPAIIYYLDNGIRFGFREEVII